MQWGEYSLNMKGGIYYFLTSISCSRNRSAFPSFFISPSQDFSISIWNISSLNIFILIPCNQFSSSCCSFLASYIRNGALDQKIDTVVISWNCGEAKWQKCQAGEFFWHSRHLPYASSAKHYPTYHAHGHSWQYIFICAPFASSSSWSSWQSSMQLSRTS